MSLLIINWTGPNIKGYTKRLYIIMYTPKFIDRNIKYDSSYTL